MIAVTQVPRHAKGVLLVQTSDTAQLVSSAGLAGLVLDPTALALWELCDGETTVEEMALAVCALFDAPLRTVEHDIAAVLAQLSGAQVLEWSPAPRADEDGSSPDAGATTVLPGR